MNAASTIMKSGQDCLSFWCPGCKETHTVNSGWTFNGDHAKPTLSPSILVTSGHYAPNWRGPYCYCNPSASYKEAFGDDPPHWKCSRCHSFVRDGQIQFLSDCTHSLKDTTVDLEPYHD